MQSSTAEKYLKLKKELLNKAFSHLNEEQRKAVFTIDGALLILAGAGSGKTTVIVNRIAYMIKYGNAYYSEYIPENITDDDITFMEQCLKDKTDDDDRLCYLLRQRPVVPYSVLAITFTNKAANELKERLLKMIGAGGDDIWASTFHSACVRILRREIDKIGYKKDFTIYDTDDSIKLIKECMKQLNIEDKTFTPKSILGTISKAKDALYTPDMYINEFGSDYRLKRIGAVYKMYQERMKSSNALDFDDLIMLTVKLLQENEETREYYRRRFRYVLVDEYQDTNKSQYKLISLLTGRNGNICVVGDDDQSIYKFRGATIENILKFEEQHDDVSVIKLEQNYRSTQNILDAANEVIKNNLGRKGKNLWTRSGCGEKVTVFKAVDQEAEADYICKTIKKLMNESGFKYNDFAVLYRTNAQSRAIENHMRIFKIPAKVLGGIGFYDRKEIRDMIAYLSVIQNPADTIRLKRIINEPKRGIGDSTLDTVQAIADSLGITPFEVIENADKYQPLSRSKDKLKLFANMINDLREKSQYLPLNELYDELLEATAYEESLKREENYEERLEITEELGSAMLIYMNGEDEPSLSGFLEGISLASDSDEYDDADEKVSLMTLHTAKGLEFPVVFIAGMEEGLFPSSMSFDEPDQIEEERRLAYVGITRAKCRLYLLHTSQRTIYGTTIFPQVSRFVKEIPDDLKHNDYVEKPAAANFSSFSRANNYSLGSFKVDTQNNPENVNSEHFEKGERVSHKVFGEGMVLSTVPAGNDVLIEIAFDKVGTKKLMANFAKLKKI